MIHSMYRIVLLCNFFFILIFIFYLFNFKFRLATAEPKVFLRINTYVVKKVLQFKGW